MTPYKVVFHAKGDAETFGLPEAAFKRLIEQLGHIRHDPWARSREDRPEDPSMRQALFGEAGIVHFMIDDESRVIRVHGIFWMG